MTWDNTTPDGLPLDHHNPEFELAMASVKAGENVFLTGEAGTGKTTFLKILSEQLASEDRSYAVVAPTGIAAVNAGGQTIHSMFKLPFKPLVMSDKIFRESAGEDSDRTTVHSSFRFTEWRLDMFKALEILIVDEVSMVRCDVLQAMDKLLRIFRKEKRHLPFGGVQMVLIGDAFQLPPVVKPAEVAILTNFYRTRFFFGSEAFVQGNFRGHILTKVYRQQDNEFVALLNRIREGALTVGDHQKLDNLKGAPEDDSGYITISTHKNKVQLKNRQKLDELPEEPELFRAEIKGKFPESAFPVEGLVKLKVGAQVMVTKNDWDLEVYNGLVGTVKDIDGGVVSVLFEENGSKRKVELVPVEWENIEYEFNKETGTVEPNVIGTFKQIPLMLAWAVTVHKSQGKTFDKVIADVNASFAFGQEYVALSRCRSMDSLHLISDLRPERLGPHPWVKRFYDRRFQIQ